MIKMEKVTLIHQNDEIKITIEERENQNLDICAEVDWYSIKSSISLSAVLKEIQIKQHFNNLGALDEIEYEGEQKIIKIEDIQAAFPNTPIKRI